MKLNKIVFTILNIIFVSTLTFNVSFSDQLYIKSGDKEKLVAEYTGTGFKTAFKQLYCTSLALISGSECIWYSGVNPKHLVLNTENEKALPITESTTTSSVAKYFPILNTNTNQNTDGGIFNDFKNKIALLESSLSDLKNLYTKVTNQQFVSNREDARVVNPATNIVQTTVPGLIHQTYVQNFGTDKLHDVDLTQNSNAMNILRGATSAPVTIGGSVVNIIYATNTQSGNNTIVNSINNTTINSGSNTSITSQSNNFSASNTNIFSAQNTTINSGSTTSIYSQTNNFTATYTNIITEFFDLYATNGATATSPFLSFISSTTDMIADYLRFTARIATIFQSPLFTLNSTTTNINASQATNIISQTNNLTASNTNILSNSNTDITSQNNNFSASTTNVTSLTNNLTASNTNINSATTTINSPGLNVNTFSANLNSSSSTNITSQTNNFTASNTNITSSTTRINSSTTTITGVTNLTTLTVGTTTPTPGKLATFAGDIDVTGTIDPTRILFSNRTGVNSPSYNPDTDGGGNYRIEFAEGAGLNFKSASTSNILHLTNTGFIGMGTSAPSANLHISSSNSETKAKFQNNAGVFSIGMGNVSSSYYSGNEALAIKNENTNTEKFFVSDNYTVVKNELIVESISTFRQDVNMTNSLTVFGSVDANTLKLYGTKFFASKNAVAFKYFPSGIADHYETEEKFLQSEYALTTDDNIRASEFHATSDERIKNIKGYSNSELDLDNLNKILITDYTLKADELSTTSPVIQKKVIAQQIEKITPNLVTKSKGFIPVEPYYVNFVKNGTTTDLYIGGIKYTGDKKFKYQHKDRTTGIWEKNTSAKISIGEAVITDEEVDDFRTVDYDGLTTLAVSSLQQLSKKLNNGFKGGEDMVRRFIGQERLPAIFVDEITASTTLSVDDKFKALGINQSEMSKILNEMASSTYPTQLASTSGDTELTFTGKIFAKIEKWLSSPLNGISQIFANRLKTKEICVTGDDGKETCINKTQLDKILSGAATSSQNSAPLATEVQPVSTSTEVLAIISTTTDIVAATSTNATSTELVAPQVETPATNVPFPEVLGVSTSTSIDTENSPSNIISSSQSR